MVSLAVLLILYCFKLCFEQINNDDGDDGDDGNDGNVGGGCVGDVETRRSAGSTCNSSSRRSIYC